eukprot:1306607-Alexandrium_andersonii.AAC.1
MAGGRSHRWNLADPPHRCQPRPLAPPPPCGRGSPPRPSRAPRAPPYLGREHLADPASPAHGRGLPLLRLGVNRAGPGPGAPTAGRPAEQLGRGPDRGRG